MKDHLYALAICLAELVGALHSTHRAYGGGSGQRPGERFKSILKSSKINCLCVAPLYHLFFLVRKLLILKTHVLSPFLTQAESSLSIYSIIVYSLIKRNGNVTPRETEIFLNDTKYDCPCITLYLIFLSRFQKCNFLLKLYASLVKFHSDQVAD